MQLLEKILQSKIRIKILRKLSLHSEWPFNVVELAGDLGLNKGSVSRVLRELQKSNIVRITSKGRAKICRINKENRIVKQLIIPLFKKEDEILEKIFQDFIRALKPQAFKSILSIVVFGSSVKGTFELTSDIDVMVVVSTPTEIENIRRALDGITRIFSKEDIAIFYDIMTSKELKKLYRDNEPSIRDIVKFNKLLYGKDILELI